MSLNVGIVGAGIMGRLLAFTLVNAQHKVTLFDKNTANFSENCSMTAAGLLTPITELEKSDSTMAEIGGKSLTTHWPRVLKQLSPSIYFRQKGTLALAHAQDRSELIRFVRFIDKIYPDKSYYQELSGDDLQSHEPGLTKFNSGYYFPLEGQLDNQTLLETLGIYLKANNVTWHENSLVKSLQSQRVLLENFEHKFDQVFDCRGLGGKEFFNDLRGVRGELIWLHAPEVDIQRPIRLLHPRYRLYIAPRPNHVYIIGASEIESEHINAISVRSALELLSAAYSLHSGFAEASIIKTAVHCRPTLTDYYPKIKFNQGIAAINGLSRHGFLLAPVLANEILHWLESGISAINYPQFWSRL